MNSEATDHRIPVEAPNNRLIGVTKVVDGWPVVYVGESAAPLIRYRKYTSDYTARSERPWRVGKRSFKFLVNALRALATSTSNQ